MSLVKVKDCNEKIRKALKCGDLEEVRRILQSNPDCLGYTDENGWTPMHLAAYWNERECLRLFIAHSLRHGIESHTAANRGGNTAIFRAASEDIMLTLLESGLEGVKANRPRDGMPPLHYCVTRGLITGPAIISALEEQADVEWRGDTPVFLAKSGRVVEMFLYQVPNLTTKRPKDAMPLLHYCAELGILNHNLVKMLARQTDEEFQGQLAVELAIANGNRDSAFLLSECLSGSNLLRLFDASDVSKARKVNPYGPQLTSDVNGNEDLRCELFDLFASDEHQLAFMKEMRRVIVQAAYAWRHQKLLLQVLRTLDPTPEDLSIETAAGYTAAHSILWTACDGGNWELASAVLAISGLVDTPSPDGTTAFDAAVGRLNADLAKLMLRSDIGGKDHMLFIAGEITRLRSEDLDESERNLKNVLNIELKRLGAECKPIATVETGPNPRRDIGLSKLCKRYPFVNEATEFRYPVNSRILKGLQNLGKRKETDGRKFEDYVLGDFCVRSPSEVWTVDEIEVLDCRHRERRRLDCILIHGLVRLAQDLQNELNTEGSPLSHLEPRLTVVGSVAEGTRIGLGNELDLTLTFAAWNGGAVPFAVRDEDAFHLYKHSSDSQQTVSEYFDESGRFLLLKFKLQLLAAIEKAIGELFRDMPRGERYGLKRVLTNEEYGRSKCPKCRTLTHSHCKRCAVAVAQSKMGVCLQFEWRHWTPTPIYCSVDVVPTFAIAPINALGSRLLTLYKYIQSLMIQTGTILGP